jgi:hypothetical protein
MYSHLAKVKPEPRLKKRPSCRVQWMARGMQYIANNRGRRARSGGIAPILIGLSARSTANGFLTRVTRIVRVASTLQCGVRPAQDTLGNALGLTLVYIAGGVDRQFWLYVF